MSLPTRLASLRPLAAALVLAFPAVQAATSSVAAVTTCDDSGPNSLRTAYFNAADGDTIDLTQLKCSRITLNSTLLENSAPANVTLSGAHITLDGGNVGRVIVHSGTGTLTLSGVDIANGSYPGPFGGGCIYSVGSVTLQDSTVSSCTLTVVGNSPAQGGAIFANDTVTLTASTVTSSSAYSQYGNAFGGGVFAKHVFIGTLDTRGATISNNTAATGNSMSTAFGGGIGVGPGSGGLMLVYNSTLSKNSADVGGATFGAVINMINMTVSGNTTNVGYGAINATASLRLHNSTVANNITGDPGMPAGAFADAGDIESSIFSNSTDSTGAPAIDFGSTPSFGGLVFGNNLIMRTNFPLPSGTDTLTADPLLGPLQYNGGGRTMTHALLTGSPAINHGTNFDNAAFDQRGARFSRTVGSATDIGAFERSTDHIFYDGFEP